MAFNMSDLIKCPICGKDFIRPPENVYKIQNSKHTKHFCSWSCYQKALQEIEAKREANRKRKKKGEDKDAGR